MNQVESLKALHGAKPMNKPELSEQEIDALKAYLSTRDNALKLGLIDKDGTLTQSAINWIETPASITIQVGEYT